MYGFLGPRPPRITYGRVVSSTRPRSLRFHLNFRRLLVATPINHTYVYQSREHGMLRRRKRLRVIGQKTTRCSSQGIETSGCGCEAERRVRQGGQESATVCGYEAERSASQGGQVWFGVWMWGLQKSKARRLRAYSESVSVYKDIRQSHWWQEGIAIYAQSKLGMVCSYTYSSE